MDQRRFLKTIKSFFSSHISLFLLCLFFLSSCEPIKFAHVRYTKEMLDPRLNAGTVGMILQTRTPNGEKAKEPLDILAYSFYNAPKAPESDILQYTNDGTSSFPNTVNIGNNRVTRAAILAAITDGGGKRVDYDYILFVPVKRRDNNYVVYQLIAFKSGQQVNKKLTPIETEPCPPALCNF